MKIRAAMQHQPRILIVDSGIGGLSILQSIVEHLPNAKFSYMADTAFWPYGDKHADAIEQRLIALLDAIDVDRFFDVAVIACNTASTLALDSLRKHFDCAFVGVVPAIKPAANISQSKKIAILATAATVQSDYLNDLTHEFASDCEVFKLALPELVDIVERNFLNHCQSTAKTQQHKLASMMQSIDNKLSHVDIDTVVLGCTHFPLLKTELQASWQKPKFWIDSGDAIARRVKHLCDGINTGYSESLCRFFCTDSQNLKTEHWLSALRFAGIKQHQVINSNVNLSQQAL
ncbi:MAG: glutamate racemase [Pseudomonadales bacterium]|nr:glutamate racemase [Pseudomonadales bacterium]